MHSTVQKHSPLWVPVLLNQMGCQHCWQVDTRSLVRISIEMRGEHTLQPLLAWPHQGGLKPVHLQEQALLLHFAQWCLAQTTCRVQGCPSCTLCQAAVQLLRWHYVSAKQPLCQQKG